MDKKKYIMWSDGVLSSIGELVEKKDCGTILVKNPVSIAFATSQEPVLDKNGQQVIDENGNPQICGKLRWEMNPYVFGACLVDSDDNIWSCKPSYVISEDAEFDSRLISHYHEIISICDTPRK